MEYRVIHKTHAAMLFILASSVLIFGWTALLTGSSQVDPRDFIILSGSEAYRSELLQCPNHAFGSMEEGVAEIVKRREERRREAPQDPIFVQLCILDQIDSIAECARLVDFATINPFVQTESTGPDSETLIWPHDDHPILNRVRKLRESDIEARLVARLDWKGSEPEFFRERPPSVEELEWMITATIGANFKGFVWINAQRMDEVNPRLRQWMNQLRAYRTSLGRAVPYQWSGEANVPVAVLLSPEHLFICVLNPGYMKSKDDSYQAVTLPVDAETIHVEFNVILPRDLNIGRGVSISGMPVRYTRADDRSLSVKHVIRGGAEIFVFNIEQPAP